MLLMMYTTPEQCPGVFVWNNKQLLFTFRSTGFLIQTILLTPAMGYPYFTTTFPSFITKVIFSN